MEENEKYLDSINGKIAKFKNELQEAEYGLVSDSLIKKVVDFGTQVLDWFNQLSKVLGSVGALATTVMTGLGMVGRGIINLDFAGKGKNNDNGKFFEFGALWKNDGKSSEFKIDDPEILAALGKNAEAVDNNTESTKQAIRNDGDATRQTINEAIENIKNNSGGTSEESPNPSPQEQHTSPEPVAQPTSNPVSDETQPEFIKPVVEADEVTIHANEQPVESDDNEISYSVRNGKTLGEERAEYLLRKKDAISKDRDAVIDNLTAMSGNDAFLLNTDIQNMNNGDLRNVINGLNNKNNLTAAEKWLLDATQAKLDYNTATSAITGANAEGDNETASLALQNQAEAEEKLKRLENERLTIIKQITDAYNKVGVAVNDISNNQMYNPSTSSIDGNFVPLTKEQALEKIQNLKKRYDSIILKRQQRDNAKLQVQTAGDKYNKALQETGFGTLSLDGETYEEYKARTLKAYDWYKNNKNSKESKEEYRNLKSRISKFDDVDKAGKELDSTIANYEALDVEVANLADEFNNITGAIKELRVMLESMGSEAQPESEAPEVEAPEIDITDGDESTVAENLQEMSESAQQAAEANQQQAAEAQNVTGAERNLEQQANETADSTDNFGRRMDNVTPPTTPPTNGGTTPLGGIATKAGELASKAGDKLKNLAMSTISGLANGVLNGLITAGVSLVTNFAVDQITEAFKPVSEKLKEARDKLDAFNQTVEQVNKTNKENNDYIDEISKEYSKLAKGVNTDTNKNISLSDSDYKRFLEITNNLGERFGSLVKDVDSSGNYILNLGTSAKTTSDVFDILNATAKEQARLAAAQVRDSIKEEKEGYDPEKTAKVYNNSNNSTNKEFLNTLQKDSEQNINDFLKEMYTIASSLGINDVIVAGINPKGDNSLNYSGISSAIDNLSDDEFNQLIDTYLDKYSDKYGKKDKDGNYINSDVKEYYRKRANNETQASIKWKNDVKTWATIIDSYANELTDDQVELGKLLVQNIDEGTTFESGKKLVNFVEKLKDQIKDIGADEATNILNFKESLSNMSPTEQVNAIDGYLKKLQTKISDDGYNFWANYFDLDEAKAQEQAVQDYMASLLSSNLTNYNFEGYNDLRNKIFGLTSSQFNDLKAHSGNATTIEKVWENYQKWLNTEAEALTFDWTNENNKTTIDDYQSNIDKLSEAWKKLEQGGKLTEDELADLAQEFKDLDVTSGSLETQIHTLANKETQALIEKLIDLGATDDVIKLFENMYLKAFTLKDAFQDLDSAVDTTQSKLETYYGNITKVKDNTFTPTDLVDLLQSDVDFRKAYDKMKTELQSQLISGEISSSEYDSIYSDSLTKLFTELSNNAMTAGTIGATEFDSTGRIAGVLIEVEDAARMSAIGLDVSADATATAIDKMKGSYTQLYDVIDEYSNNHDLSAETLNGIMTSEPQLIDKVQRYMLDSSEKNYNELVEGLKEAYQEDYDNYYQYMEYKTMRNGDFYKKEVMPAANAAVGNLLNQYKIDLAGFASTEDAKTSIAEKQAAARYKLQQINLNQYDEIITNLRKEVAVNGISDKDKGIAEGKIRYYEGLKNKLAEQANSTNQEIDDYQTILDSLTSVFKAMFGIFDDSIAGSYDEWLERLRKAQEEAAKASKNTIDWFEYLIDEFDKLEAKVNSYLNKAASAKGKNSLLESLIDMDTAKMGKYQQAAKMYQDYADTYLVKIPAQYQAAAKNGSVAITDFYQGDVNDEIVKNIENYRTWRDKALDAENQAIELSNTIRQYLVQEVTNLNTEFTRLNNILETTSSQLQSVVSLVAEMGYNENSEAGLTAQLEASKTELAQLEAQAPQLQQALNDAIARGVVVGSEEWETLNGYIDENKNKQISVQTEIAKLSKLLRNLPIDRVNQISAAFDNLKTTLSFINEQMDNTVVSTDGTGLEFDNEAVTTMGINTQIIQARKIEQEEIAKQMTELERKFKSGEITYNEYTEAYSALQSKAISAANDIKEAEKSNHDIIVQLYTEKINFQNELIEKQKEEIEKQKEAYNWQKTLLGKQKELLNEERKLNALSAGASSDRATAAKAAQQASTVNDKREDLQDTVDDHNTTERTNALSKLAERNTKAAENMSADPAEIIKQMKLKGYADIGDKTLYYSNFADDESLKEAIKNIQDTSDQVTQIVNDSKDDIADTIDDAAKKSGVTITDDITSAWKGAGNAVDAYNTSVKNMSSGTSKMLRSLIAQVDTNIAKTEALTQKYMAAFGITTSDTKKTIDDVTSSLKTCDEWVGTVKTDVDSFLNGLNDSVERLGTVLGDAAAAIDAILKDKPEETPTTNSGVGYTASQETSDKYKSDRTGYQKNTKYSVVNYAGDRTGYQSNTSLQFDQIAMSAAEVAVKLKNVNSELQKIKNEKVQTYVKLKLELEELEISEKAQQTFLEMTKKYTVDIGKNNTFTSDWYNSRTVTTKNDKGGVVTAQKFATGGVITANSGTYVSAGSPLDAIARRLGEDTMIAAKRGERVLTIDQNKQWEQWTKAMPNLISLMENVGEINSTNNANPIILNIDSGITINGNADDNTIKQLQRMQDQLANNVTNKIANALKSNLGLKVNAFNKSVY